VAWLCSRPRKGRLVPIWGFRATSVVLTTAVYVCDRCGTNAAHRLTKRVRRFTLFFVPLFSVSTTYVDTCTACAGTSKWPTRRPRPR